MADDPFADYKSPSKTDDPFAGYKSPTKMPAALTYDTTDPNSSWGSWALSKLHNAAVGGNLWSKAFQDSSTFGGADVLQGKIAGSPSTEELRAQTEEARKQIGPVGNLTADIAGYAMVPGGLKVGEGLAALRPASKLAQIGGSAIEGAGASGLGTLGHGGSWEDAGSSALVGGALGTVTGLLPGGRSPQPTKGGVPQPLVPKAPTTADLQATSQQAFAPLKGKVYNAGDVGNKIAGVTSGMSAGDVVSMGPSLADARNVMTSEVGNRAKITADDIAKFQRELKAAAGGNDARQQIAHQYVNALNKGVGPQTEAAIKGANRASNIAKTSGEIEGWLAAPGDAPKAIKGALKDNPDFYKAQPGLFDALTKIGSKADEPGWMRQVINHGLTMAAGSALGEGVDYVTGDTGHKGLLTGAISGATMPKVRSFVRTGPVKGGLLAAQHLNATGQALPTSAFTNPWLQMGGNLARRWGYGAGAAGDITDQ